MFKGNGWVVVVFFKLTPQPFCTGYMFYAQSTAKGHSYQGRAMNAVLGLTERVQVRSVPPKTEYGCLHGVVTENDRARAQSSHPMDCSCSLNTTNRCCGCTFILGDPHSVQLRNATTTTTKLVRSINSYRLMNNNKEEL